jgi:hypothetical protein
VTLWAPNCYETLLAPVYYETPQAPFYCSLLIALF